MSQIRIAALARLRRSGKALTAGSQRSQCRPPGCSGVLLGVLGWATIDENERSFVQRALVVGSDPSVAEDVVDPLRTEGFVVEVAPNGATGCGAAMARTPDVIVLVDQLPDMNSVALIRRLRDVGLRAPIIVLTANDLLSALVEALTAGADDYVKQQVTGSELVARVRNLIRRARPLASDVLRFADVVVDQSLHSAHRAGVFMDLSPIQYRLLWYFMLNPRRVLSKETLLLHVWNRESTDDYNLVETVIGRLRRKLEEHGPPLIRTLRRQGYVLRGPD